MECGKHVAKEQRVSAGSAAFTTPTLPLRLLSPSTEQKTIYGMVIYIEPAIASRESSASSQAANIQHCGDTQRG